MVLLPLLSVVVVGSKLQTAPCSTVLFVLLHVITGAVVSTIVTFWLHWAKLPHASVACHVRVGSKVVPQWPVTAVAVGASKLQAAPCSTVLLVLLHVITGAVVSTIVTFWLH